MRLDLLDANLPLSSKHNQTNDITIRNCFGLSDRLTPVPEGRGMLLNLKNSNGPK
jgi:hypothetical protein